jgi:hypothetical protein
VCVCVCAFVCVGGKEEGRKGGSRCTLKEWSISNRSMWFLSGCTQYMTQCVQIVKITEETDSLHQQAYINKYMDV